ncbi:MAG TPA: hypothetical protein VFD36_09645 [Kofleriaceae bacterium]|jgi:hypothetical protein|nr:hypothetical protein [Kofleriaceae bacterium]
MLPWAVAWACASALPVLAVVVPWRCSLVAPSLEARDASPSAAQPKEEAPVERVSSAPPRAAAAAPVVTIELPEEVVVRAVATGQPAFLRCWARAQRVDALDAAKVRLHLEVDATGKITQVATDAESATLSRCLAVVARQLPFPAPGRPAAVDVPLLFR